MALNGEAVRQDHCRDQAHDEQAEVLGGRELEAPEWPAGHCRIAMTTVATQPAKKDATAAMAARASPALAAI